MSSWFDQHSAATAVKTYGGRNKRAPSSGAASVLSGSSTGASLSSLASSSSLHRNNENDRSRNPPDCAPVIVSTNSPRPTPLKDAVPNRQFRNDKFTLNNIDPRSVIKDHKIGEKRAADHLLTVPSTIKNSKSRITSPESSSTSARVPSSVMSSRGGSSSMKPQSSARQQKGRKGYQAILASGRQVDIDFLFSAVDNAPPNVFQGLSLKASNWKTDEADHLKAWMETMGFQETYLSTQRVFVLAHAQVDSFRRDLVAFKSQRTQQETSLGHELELESSRSCVGPPVAVSVGRASRMASKLLATSLSMVSHPSLHVCTSDML